jgi:hypothetical protein
MQEYHSILRTSNTGTILNFGHYDTGLFLWNQVLMGDAGMKFDDIGWEDMEDGHSIEIMRTFVKSCCSRPPIQQRENKPYDSSSVVKAFQTGL